MSRIVADHRGYIRDQENEPRGTRFVIELPVPRMESERADDTMPAAGESATQ